MGKTTALQSGGTREWRDPFGDHWLIDTEWAEVDGRAECVGLTIRSYAPLDADKIRPVRKSERVRPIRAEVLRAFTMSVVDEVRQSFEFVYSDTGPLASDDPAKERRRRALHKTFTTGRGVRLVGADGKPLATVDALAEVAEIYRAASRAGRPPTQAVADALKLSKSAAAKRVGRAREAGLLPPTQQGKAAIKEAK